MNILFAVDQDTIGDHGTVAVWSLGRDGQMGTEGDRIKSGSDDVTTW